MRRLPERTKHHSFIIIGLLFFLLVIGSIGVGYLVQKNPLLHVFDSTIYQFFNGGVHTPWIDALVAPFNFGSFLGMQIYYYVMVFGWWIYVFFTDRKQLGWAIFATLLASVLVRVVSLLDWHFVFRSRPFLNLPHVIDETGISVWKNLPSYPSGHSRDTALYSTLIATYIPQLRIPLLLFTIFVAASRLYLGAHYPTDVIAGCLIGYFTAKISLTIARQLQIIKDPHRSEVSAEKPL